MKSQHPLYIFLVAIFAVYLVFSTILTHAIPAVVQLSRLYMRLVYALTPTHLHQEYFGKLGNIYTNLV